MTTAPPRPPAPTRRPWTPLDIPQVIMTGVALVVFDLVMAVVVAVVRGDPSCATIDCRVNGVDTTRPLVALLVAVGVLVLPVLVAWWRRRGLRTALTVQVVVGGLLVAYAATSLVTAFGVRDDPPPVPVLPSLRPCAAVTLEGKTCLTYAVTPPPPTAATP